MNRPPAIFVADAPGLDFLNSIATPVDTPVDWIDDGEGLLSWLEQARLVPADTLDSIRTNALPGELDKVADQARSLREWFRGFARQHKRRPLTPGDIAQLDPLNRLLERDELFQADRPSGRKRSSPASDGSPMANSGSPSATDRRGAGAACLHRGLLSCESLRGPRLHADVRRPHARSHARGGAAWRSAETGRSRPLTGNRLKQQH